MTNAQLLSTDVHPITTVRGAQLQCVRISVRNGSVARHFWETALGLEVAEEIAVTDPAIRQLWGIEEGTLRLTRLEIAPDISPKIELLEWEGCSDVPIRDARHPWDYGLLAIRIPVSDLDARLARLAQWRCKISRNGIEASVATPGGERIILRQGGEPAVLAVVPSIDQAAGFFRDSLLMPNGIPARVEHCFSGAASVDLVRSLRLGALEVVELKRSADPRPALATESRMHAGYTGLCMLSVAAAGATGPTVMMRAPGGIPVEVFSTAHGRLIGK